MNDGPEPVQPVALRTDRPDGIPLEDVTDIDELRWLVGFLYDRLDDIDTEDDICKSNDKRYRERVRKHQQKRLVRIRSDGYNLFVTLQKPLIGKELK